MGRSAGAEPTRTQHVAKFAAALLRCYRTAGIREVRTRGREGTSYKLAPVRGDQE